LCEAVGCPVLFDATTQGYVKRLFLVHVD
jgi:hypothetical protein